FPGCSPHSVVPLVPLLALMNLYDLTETGVLLTDSLEAFKRQPPLGHHRRWSWKNPHSTNDGFTLVPAAIGIDAHLLNMRGQVVYHLAFHREPRLANETAGAGRPFKRTNDETDRPNMAKGFLPSGLGRQQRPVRRLVATGIAGDRGGGCPGCGTVGWPCRP